MCLLILSSCAKKVQAYNDVEKIILEKQNSKIESENSYGTKNISDETLSSVQKFVFDYYTFRTKIWANSLFELLNKKELGSYLSEYFESHGVLNKQALYIVDDNFRIGEVELLPQRTIGFKNNESVVNDVYKVEVINSIIGEIKDNKLIEKNELHKIYIFIIDENSIFKVIGDQDIRWYENQEGLKLANVYIFEGDVSRVLKE